MSSQTSSFEVFQSAIARIYRSEPKSPNSQVVGAGFPISERYLLTCAHVVSSALYPYMARETSEAPTQSIDIDFPRIAPRQKLKAKVVFWKPVRSVTDSPSERGEDLAVLELESELPQQVRPVIAPVVGKDLWNHSFRVFGFPAQHENGVWATGILKGEELHGWIQIVDDQITGYRIKPGFSGAPIWDTNLACVVGIIVATETESEVKAAFMIPTGELRAQIPQDFFSCPDSEIEILLPAVDPPYQPIIDAFAGGNIIPFLGAGIHAGDGSRGMPIELALRLAQDFNPQGKLLGLPCSFCPLSLDAKPPIGCPIWSRIPEGENRDDSVCPLSHEQRLVLAQMNLRFLSQYMSFVYKEEDEEDDRRGFYGAMHQHLDSTYNKLLNDDTNIYRLYEFLATLPQVMLKKGYRSFPCPLIITTNFDEMLERIFDRVKQEYDLVFYVAEGPEKGHFKHKTHEGKEKIIEYDEDYLLPLKERPLILKLYGTWTDKFVMTEEHLINYLFGHSIQQVLPSQLMRFVKKSKILFLGYSLKDPDLQIILHRFWGNNPVKILHNKSWIVHQSQPGDLEREFWQDRNVKPIESSLEDFITNLEMGIERLESKIKV